MTTQNPELSREEHESNLALLMRKNAEYYRALSDNTAPLTEEVLRGMERGTEIVESPEFAQMKALIGWPDGEDASHLTWNFSFASDEIGTEDFIIALHDPKAKLNNAPITISTEPASVEGAPYGVSDFHISKVGYVTRPYLMRANLLAPELFSSLNSILSGLTGIYEKQIYYVQHAASLDDPVLNAMKVAYMMLGKCMRTEDNTTQMKLLGVDSQEPVIEEVTGELKK